MLHVWIFLQTAKINVNLKKNVCIIVLINLEMIKLKLSQNVLSHMGVNIDFII
jgi:hypothetical protein